MSNLLPKTYREEIRTDYRLRLTITSLFALAALLIIGITLLVPSYVSSKNKQNITENELEQVRLFLTKDTQEDPYDVIKEINNTLARLKPSDKETMSAYDTIINVLSQKDTGIKIQSLFYVKGEEVVKVSFSGTASTRQKLLDFKERLEKVDTFTGVELPISNFVKNENIDFSITINVGNASSNKNVN